MDLWMIILRLVHIFAGVMWVGFGIFMTFFFVPTARQQQANGTKFMHAFLQHTSYEYAMPVLSILTTLAGVLLYLRVSGNFNLNWIASPGGLVLTLGSVAGTLAFLHGAFQMGPLTQKQKAALERLDAQQGPPPDELITELQELGAKMGRHSMISLVLMVIAIIGMASARYIF